jgi:hypothetical protein
MCRTNKIMNVKSRLCEMDQRFAELSAVSARLASMVAQLDRLRTVDQSICHFTDRSTSSHADERILFRQSAERWTQL